MCLNEKPSLYLTGEVLHCTFTGTLDCTLTGSLKWYSLVSLGAKMTCSVAVWFPNRRPAMGVTLNTPEDAFGGSMAKMTGILEEFDTCPIGNKGFKHSDTPRPPDMRSFFVYLTGRRPRRVFTVQHCVVA